MGRWSRRDWQIASIAAALAPVLEKEERSGRSAKGGALPEACSSQTTKRGKAVLEPPPTPERIPLASEKVSWVKPKEYVTYRARQIEHRDQLMQAGSTSTSATTTTASTAATTAATTPAAVTTAGALSPPAPPPVTQFLGTGRHPRAADREETLRVLMRKTKFSGHSNVDTDVADYDDHYLESLFLGRAKSGLIYLGPDERASEHKIRVNLKMGTKNTRIGVPRELKGWMKNHALSRQHDFALNPFRRSCCAPSYVRIARRS